MTTAGFVKWQVIRGGRGSSGVKSGRKWRGRVQKTRCVCGGGGLARDPSKSIIIARL